MSECGECCKRAYKSLAMITAGSIAGCVETLLLYPLDLIKTRLQVQETPLIFKCLDPCYYTGITDCARKVHLSEGFRAYYKGIMPPLLAQVPKRTAKFISFDVYRNLLLYVFDKPSAITYSLAGLGAGVTEALVINGFEVVKIRLQMDGETPSKMPSTWKVTKCIIREQGIGTRGLNKGLVATMYRNGIYNSVYFGLYFTMKGYFPKNKDPVAEFGRRYVTALACGVLGTVVDMPFDVAKTRIQAPAVKPGGPKYRYTFKTIRTVYEKEGFLALYKGLWVRIVRLVPGGAIMLVVYDYVFDTLNEDEKPKNTPSK